MRPHSKILVGDVIEQLRTLPDASVHCCVTSPPYWGLRDYGVDGQIGLEKTPEEFVGKMVAVFSEVRRVLRDDGTCWLNIGDSYNAYNGNRGPSNSISAATEDAIPAVRGGHGLTCKAIRPKSLHLIPWRLAIALQEDGWIVRSVICWAKKSPMPESVTDRPTSSWEPIFLLAKRERYFYDITAVKEPATNKPPGNKNLGKFAEYGRNDSMSRRQQGKVSGALSGAVEEKNLRNVWHLGPEPYAEAHFATFPTEIPRRAILAGTSEKGCCPECGAPWLRITSKEKVTRERPNDYVKPRKHASQKEGIGQSSMLNSCGNTVAGVSVSTIGWEPTCNHEAEPIPCTVLEPFLGSGTTLQVARSLGRSGIGIELNPAYVELAERRIKRPCKWEPGYDDPSPVKACAGQRSLFGESH